MVTAAEVVRVVLSGEHGAIAVGQAARAEMGGVSHVRAARERDEKLSEDQLVGQYTQMALSLYLTGAIKDYLTQRLYCNLYPTQGDGGFDLPGTNLDVKGSMMRATKDPMFYSLLVRERERAPGKIYVLGLVPALPKPGQAVGVYLVGWATDEMLPAEPEAEGPRQGAYRVRAEDLQPLMPLSWWGMGR